MANKPTRRDVAAGLGSVALGAAAAKAAPAKAASSSKPMRVGVLNDMAAEAPAQGKAAIGDITPWLRRAVDELRAAGRLDRDVEFVHSYGMGLPSGTAAAVEHAYKQLVEQDCLLIVGPAIGDNALVATPLVEAARVPTIHWAGAERARGEYMFHLQVGSHEDESIILARHMKAMGAKSVGVIYDRSPIGRRHLQFLQEEADIIGLHIAASIGIGPLAEDATAELAPMLGNIDALFYLGLGLAAPAVARAAREKNFQGPRAMNTAGLRGYHADFAKQIDGWVYVDMHSDKNETLNALMARLGKEAGNKTAAAKGYDLGRLAAEGLARAPERTREGVKHGLEQVKYLPAAEGHEGTTLGFGPFDRGALHGRYLVLRQWQDGETVEV